MSENILEPIANSLSEAFKVGLKCLYKAMNIKPYFDIVDFFKQVEFKNKQGQYPKLIKVYESPKGYTYLLSVPLGLSLADFEKIKGALEIQLRNNIQIRDRKGYIEIEVITKEIASKIEYKIPIRDKSIDYIKIPIAEGIEGTVYLNLKENPNTLISGTTGSGKSVCSKSILTSLVNMYSSQELELYLIDFKIVELAMYRNLKHTKAYVNNVEEAKELIADLMEICNKRYEEFFKHGVSNIYDYNKLNGVKKMNFKILFIEEFVGMLEDKKKVGMTILKRFASLCRACGMFLFCSMQRADNTVIDLVLRANLNNRLIFRVEDEANSKLVLDTIGAEKLRGNGHALVKMGGIITECQGYYITDNQVKQYTKKYITNKRYEPIRATEKSLKTNNDILVEKENKEPIKANKEANTITDLSFIDNL